MYNKEGATSHQEGVSVTNQQNSREIYNKEGAINNIARTDDLSSQSMSQPLLPPTVQQNTERILRNTNSRPRTPLINEEGTQTNLEQTFNELPVQTNLEPQGEVDFEKIGERTMPPTFSLHLRSPVPTANVNESNTSTTSQVPTNAPAPRDATLPKEDNSKPIGKKQIQEHHTGNTNQSGGCKVDEPSGGCECDQPTEFKINV